MCLALCLLTLSCTSTGGEKRGKSKKEVLPGVTADCKLSEDGALLTLIFECECEYIGSSICEVRDVDRPNEREWGLFSGNWTPGHIVSFEVVVPQGESWEPIAAETTDGRSVGLFTKDYNRESNFLNDDGIRWYQAWSPSDPNAVLLDGGDAFKICIYPPYPSTQESYIRTELKMRRYK